MDNSFDRYKLLIGEDKFNKLKTKGIEHSLFAEYFLISGLVLNSDIIWISFHGSYDFAYMLKLLINTPLPERDEDFTNLLIEYFPNHYDIRILLQGKDNLRGGLNKLASNLDIYRLNGSVHQAGSDSIVTAEVFFKLIQSKIIDESSLISDKNVLFGIGEGEDNNETISYTKFIFDRNQGGQKFPNSISGFSYNSFIP